MPSSSTLPARRLRMRAHGGHGRRIVARQNGPAAAFSAAGARRRPWLARLRRALDEGRFTLHYQPIVALADGRVSHYEALLRLADGPRGTLVAPASFLPAAERYGLVQEIDRMVLARVAALLGRHEGPVVAVNLSAVSVTDELMPGVVEQALARHRVAPRRLIVEITETAAISDMALAREFCVRVQALGCAVALDDFGAGFGSFQYLKHLPFDHLKIDGEFIRALPRSRTDQLVVRALADLARAMGRRTVAEFVGDRATLSLLADYGVDYAQGFAVGRPAPALPRARRAHPRRLS